MSKPLKSSHSRGAALKESLKQQGKVSHGFCFTTSIQFYTYFCGRGLSVSAVSKFCVLFAMGNWSSVLSSYSTNSNGEITSLWKKIILKLIRVCILSQGGQAFRTDDFEGYFASPAHNTKVNVAVVIALLFVKSHQY